MSVPLAKSHICASSNDGMQACGCVRADACRERSRIGGGNFNLHDVLII